MSNEKTKNFFQRNLNGSVFSLDHRSMALFRVALGAMLILDLILRLGDLRAHYTDFGIVPRAPYIDNFVNDLYISLHLGGGTIGWQIVLFSVALLSSFCFLIGYRTKLATLVSWFLLISLQSRNHIILNGGDVFLRNIMFWSLFLPLGVSYSVDAALNRERLKSYLYKSIPAACIILQIILLYMCSGFLKTGKEWWPVGTAAYFALSLDQFATHFGKWLLNFPEFLKYASWGTVWWEKLGPLLFICPIFFAPLRIVAILGFIGMHLFFDLSMRIGIFPWINISVLFILLPPAFWDTLKRHFLKPSEERATLFYDGGCNFCLKLVLIVKQLLLLKKLPHQKAQEDSEAKEIMERENSWVLGVMEEGSMRYYIKFRAFLRLLSLSPLPFSALIKFLKIKIFLEVGTTCYQWVASNRSRLSVLTKKFLPFQEKLKTKNPLPIDILAGVLILYVAAWNFTHFKWNDFRFAKWAKIPARLLRIDQRWNMFAAYPLKDDGWFVIEGELMDGRPVDVWRKSIGPVSFEKPDYVAGMYSNARWRKYLMNIRKKKNSDYRLYYGKYLCRNWNTQSGILKKDKLSKFKIYYMLEKTPPPGGEYKYGKKKIWSHNCYKKSKK